MPVVGQRRHGDVGDVVGVDEGLELVGGRQHDLAVEDRLQQVVLAEVLHEPGAANDRHVGARLLHGMLGALGLLFAPAREQHQPADVLFKRDLGEERTASDAPGIAKSGKKETYADARPARAAPTSTGPPSRTAGQPSANRSGRYATSQAARRPGGRSCPSRREPGSASYPACCASSLLLCVDVMVDVGRMPRRASCRASAKPSQPTNRSSAPWGVRSRPVTGCRSRCTSSCTLNAPPRRPGRCRPWRRTYARVRRGRRGAP